MALTALNLTALAGLLVGTGAMATYVVGPATATATATPPASAPVEIAAPQSKSCEAQTWPYIESRCVTGRAQQSQTVRLVMAPREGASDATVPEASVAVAPQMEAPPAAAKLVTRDTVGRSVEPAAPQATPEPRRVEKRRRRDERRIARQSYQVPSETSARRDTRPVIVVRPLRLDMFN